MRGKGFGVVRRNGRPRITPAYAGKRPAEIEEIFGGGDHPRVCGEKCAAFTRFVVAVGSPPRMRGKDAAEMPEVWRCRITPAYAGKRYVAGDTLKSFRDHPRVCGEKASHTLIQ